MTYSANGAGFLCPAGRRKFEVINKQIDCARHKPSLVGRCNVTEDSSPTCQVVMMWPEKWCLEYICNSWQTYDLCDTFGERKSRKDSGIYLVSALGMILTKPFNTIFYRRMGFHIVIERFQFLLYIIKYISRIRFVTWYKITCRSRSLGLRQTAVSSP